MDDAGYPDGFEMELLVYTADLSRVQLGDMINAMWAEINVKVNLLEMEGAAYGALTMSTAESGYRHKNAFTGGLQSPNPLKAIESVRRQPWNRYHFVDDYVIE